MSEIVPIGINVKKQKNSENRHVYIIVKGDMNASILRSQIEDVATVTYLYLKSPVGIESYEIQFQFQQAKPISIEVEKSGKVLNWLDFIDAGLFTHLWIAFDDGKGKVSRYGKSILL